MDEVTYNKLRDFDWTVSMMLSSDKLSDLHRPILQLKLDTETSDGKIHSNLLELSVEESQRLLKSLKTAQRALVRK